SEEPCARPPVTRLLPHTSPFPETARCYTRTGRLPQVLLRFIKGDPAGARAPGLDDRSWTIATRQVPKFYVDGRLLGVSKNGFTPFGSLKAMLAPTNAKGCASRVRGGARFRRGSAVSKTRPAASTRPPCSPICTTS